MTISKYQLADYNEPNLKTSRMVLWFDGDTLRRFDYDTEAWVDDREMLGIFSGSPEVIPITTEQARAIIEGNGGTWTH